MTVPRKDIERLKPGPDGKSGGGKGAANRYRSTVSGRYVTEGYAKRHPKTTVKESKAGTFAEGFMERYPETFHELSKR